MNKNDKTKEIIGIQQDLFIETKRTNKLLGLLIICCCAFFIFLILFVL